VKEVISIPVFLRFVGLLLVLLPLCFAGVRYIVDTRFEVVEMQRGMNMTEITNRLDRIQLVQDKVCADVVALQVMVAKLGQRVDDKLSASFFSMERAACVDCYSEDRHVNHTP